MELLALFQSVGVIQLVPEVSTITGEFLIVHAAAELPTMTVVVTLPPSTAEDVICTFNVSPELIVTALAQDPVPFLRTCAPPPETEAVTVPVNPVMAALVA
jgi:hypothetical protein